MFRWSGAGGKTRLDWIVGPSPVPLAVQDDQGSMRTSVPPAREIESALGLLGKSDMLIAVHNHRKFVGWLAELKSITPESLSEWLLKEAHSWEVERYAEKEWVPVRTESLPKELSKEPTTLDF